MGASRSKAAAVAALLAGCVVTTVHAQSLDRTFDQAAIVAPGAADAGAAATHADGSPAPSTPSSVPTGMDAPKGTDSAAPPAEATAPTVPADPLAAAVAARLADTAPLLARLTTRDREAMQAFYALGAFKPVWIVDGALTQSAKAAVSRLALAAEDGLAAQAYPVPVVGTHPMSAIETAETDLKLSAAIVLYAKDARGGRINLSSLSRLITPTLDIPGADAVLGRIASAGAEAGTLLQRYNPGQPGYLALKARLAASRPAAAPDAATLRLPPGPVLKLGMQDPRVPALRARFGLEPRTAGTLDAGPGEPDAYDRDVVAAVSAFQRGRGLPANGLLTQQTLTAMARPDPVSGRDDGDAALIVNMERWRWLPGDLGRDYVMVNIPEFRLRIVRNGAERDEARVIVGKTETPTPIFSGLMEYAVVNPSWNVPPSILKNEFLPGLARDPNYAARRGYEIVYHGNTVSVRQPPGERNALGFIKFLFPNNHAVYLHDTPNRSLFSAAHRALSHGCVRVDDPFRFADSVLPEAWSSERLKKLIGKGERTIRLAEKLPVHLAYFTAYVDALGGYRTLPDLYGYDARMKIALGLAPGPLLVAKVPAEPKRAAVRAPRPMADAAVVRPVRPMRTTATRPPSDFGDPDLWTPRPTGNPRTWW